MRAREREETRRVECSRKRLDAQAGNQRMLVYCGLSPQHGAEAPRIPQAHHAIAKHEIEVIVLFCRRAVRQDAQAARHAEVQDQVPVAEVYEQVFPAASNRLHFAPGELSHCARDRPAQAWLTDRDSRNHPPSEVRQKSSARDFYFGQFRHDN